MIFPFRSLLISSNFILFSSTRQDLSNGPTFAATFRWSLRKFTINYTSFCSASCSAAAQLNRLNFILFPRARRDLSNELSHVDNDHNLDTFRRKWISLILGNIIGNFLWNFPSQLPTPRFISSYQRNGSSKFHLISYYFLVLVEL